MSSFLISLDPTSSACFSPLIISLFFFFLSLVHKSPFLSHIGIRGQHVNVTVDLTYSSTLSHKVARNLSIINSISLFMILIHPLTFFLASNILLMISLSHAISVSCTILVQNSKNFWS